MSDTYDLKVTQRRQVTLPRTLCRALGVDAGGRVLLERRVVDGQMLWVLGPHQRPTGRGSDRPQAT